MKNKLQKLIRNLSVLILAFFFGCQKDKDFKITEWNSRTNKPIIFFISGDAGFNTFTKSLGTDLHTLGYDVFALDTKAYFWNKKTPEQTSLEIENYIKQQLQGRKNQQVVLLGFSFGADVTPFVYNRFTPDLKEKIQKVFIIGPSKSNDFKIHLDEYFGVEPKGSLQVIPEINEMGTVPVMVVLSDFEFTRFPYKTITLGANYHWKHIVGNHHYGNNTQMLAKFIKGAL